MNGGRQKYKRGRRRIKSNKNSLLVILRARKQFSQFSQFSIPWIFRHSQKYVELLSKAHPRRRLGFAQHSLYNTILQ
jgi:hypothetical protein